MQSYVKAKSLPGMLSFSDAKLYIFSFVFTLSAVFFPWLLHQFNLAGSQFLPMHFFIMIAGFLFGWRTGLITGVLSPLMSFSLTHMPSVVILPEVILELAVYGFAIGLLREKKLNIWISLISAMALGRLARALFVFSFGLKTNPLEYFQMSWPGVVLQIALVPLIIIFLQKFVLKENEKAI